MKGMLRVLLLAILLLAPLPASQASGQLFFMEDQNVGHKAPDFTLDTLQGKNVNMTQYRDGKSAIIFFWATWCPHCRVALKNLNTNAEYLEKKGIKIILVDLGESSDEVSEHLLKNRINFNAFLDRNSSLSEPYGIIGVPTFFLVDDQGIVKAVEHTLPDNFEEILIKKEVSQGKTKYSASQKK